MSCSRCWLSNLVAFYCVSSQHWHFHTCHIMAPLSTYEVGCFVGPPRWGLICCGGYSKEWRQSYLMWSQGNKAKTKTDEENEKHAEPKTGVNKDEHTTNSK